VLGEKGGARVASDSARLIPSLPKQADSLRGGEVPGEIEPNRVCLDRILEEDVFHSLLVLERRRAQRSRHPFVLLLLDTMSQNGTAEKLSYEILDVLPDSVRETDLIGWYKKGSVSAIIFTEVALNSEAPVTESLKAKIIAALERRLGKNKVGKIAITAHLFPEEDREHPGSIADSKLYPDLQRQASRKRVSLAVKRTIDVVGSALILSLLSPVFAVIALLIKLTSKGPVLFQQERLGLCGARFKCLKFRTMHINCDSKIHQEFVHQFITGKIDCGGQDASRSAIYKITDDPRVTSIGRFLRRTSLDECPQFWNVLRGEMSLVGPRPPVPYEFDAYDIWHRRRILEVKPGITGLWQVSGRSRVRFEEMVRLDVRYSQRWSLWLDLKILAATPWAVCSGEGAH
jgi:lipopolysaccharide/colanic/teichoic acid biosynthesis glycosyltransferase